jgi:hypothetical protein
MESVGRKQAASERARARMDCGDRALSIHCLRGLIETDGCVYLDRGYQMVSFSTVIPGLAQQVDEMMWSLGFRPRLYRIRQCPEKASFKYQVRLSRGVRAFLDLIRPLKA